MLYVAYLNTEYSLSEQYMSGGGVNVVIAGVS